ncbi:AAA family ATPase [Sorangium sp. So ce131]|uniref:AAA family ATPase n=1 Tax=Sorangium sp. So ce131 TaxID=3133282 RepID=UPI003F600879
MTHRPSFQRYQLDSSSDQYIASFRLATAVNTALAAQQPLVVTGEPGTGKTTLADSIALRLGWGKPLKFVTRSDHLARDCLYTFDSLRRLYDAQVHDERAKDPAVYVRYEALGEAILSPTPCVVVIDEIDKAPRDFPNDLLGILDKEKPSFSVRETGETHTAQHCERFVLITSNSERQLPEAFLRRCVYHHIEFPSRQELERIVSTKFDATKISERFVGAAVGRFEDVRKLRLEKRPSTGELLVWIKVLLAAGVSDKDVETKPLADLHPGTLAKLKGDLEELLKEGSCPPVAS